MSIIPLLPQEHNFEQPLGLLSDCHRRIERFLAILIKVVDDAPTPLAPAYEQGLRGALDYFEQAAPLHTEDEERSLFPRMQHSPEAQQAIAALQADHAQAEQLHAEVHRLGQQWLREGALGEDSRQELRQLLLRLDAIYCQHIPAEDQQVFPLAARLLSEEALREVGREMAARRGLEGQSGL